jgi:endonuclease YncB( thermonuclease family)
VSYDHDGDTVKLDDGRKIRLIGINAPEVARDGRPAEAFALPARDLLRTLLSKHENRVRLVHGQETQDHYQRTLAHLFLPDGTNLQAQLLASGLVNAITIPPNSRFSGCYQQAEKQALCAQQGLWSGKISNLADLDETSTGFRVLRARLVSMQSSSKGLWLTLEHGLSLHIAHQHLALFDIPKLQSLIGKSVIIRGWLQTKNTPKAGERFYMQIKHPTAIDEEKIALKC